MAIPTTGPVRFSAYQSEFGGSHPIRMSEYYRNAGAVTANNTSIPNNTGATTIRSSNFRGAIRAITMTYEIIGGGGGGGSGWLTANRGTDGQASTLSFTPAGGSAKTITSPGGAGGRGGIQTGWGDGSRSYYGSGGAAGASSDSNNQTAGYPAPSTSYGAGGGGGGANSFSSRNGGEGGYAGGINGAAYNVYAWNSGSYITRYVGMPSTGSDLVAPGQTISIYIGAAGSNINPDPGTDGRAGASGYCRLAFGNTVATFTSVGWHSYVVPG